MAYHDLGAAFITGAGKRIGRAIALKLAAQGYRIAVHFHESQGAAQDVCDHINASGGQSAALSCDLANTAALADCLDDAMRSLGPVTCLVNNASTFAPDRFETMSGADWDQHFAVNVKAPVFLAQAFAAMLPPQRQGSIINIIDQRVWKLTPQYYSYTLSKAALWTATQTMAQALAPRIRVNAIGPGPTLASIHQGESDFAAQCDVTPLKRATAPEEIADAVAFLARASAITGQMIALDSGQHLAWQTPDTAFDGD